MPRRRSLFGRIPSKYQKKEKKNYAGEEPFFALIGNNSRLWFKSNSPNWLRFLFLFFFFCVFVQKVFKPMMIVVIQTNSPIK